LKRIYRKTDDIAAGFAELHANHVYRLPSGQPGPRTLAIGQDACSGWR